MQEGLPPPAPGSPLRLGYSPYTTFQSVETVTQSLMNDPAKRRAIHNFSGCELDDESIRRLYELFCRLDTDHSGGLSAEDLDIAKSAICASDATRQTRKQAAMMAIIDDLKLGEADEDGDGQVDFGEFCTAFKKKVLTQRFSYPAITVSHEEMMFNINVELNRMTKQIVSQMADYLAQNS